MTKKELLENYTMEQLADMVIEKYNREKSEERPYGAHYDLEDGKAIRFIGFEREEAEPLFALICERITEKPMSLFPSDKLLQEVDEIKSLKDQLQRKETTINQIDDILNELFGVTHDVVENTDEFKEILKGNINGYISIQQDPIDIASNLIKAFCWQGKEYLPLECMELRQIAEHLLIYCNSNAKRGTKMTENNHKLEIKIPEYTGCCNGIQIYIDREKINAIGLYPLDWKGKRIENFEEMDLTFDFAELEVRDIEDIAVLMNEETFNKFCELWRKHHNVNKE